MEYIIVSIILVVFIVLLKILLNINFKELKILPNDEELDEISEKFPDNNTVCKSILKMIKNESTKIEQSKSEKSNTSLYIVLGNKIILGNLKNNFTRIQTIAHECIHSIQPRKILFLNFIFSNIYNIYFFVLIILTLLKITTSYNMQIVILLILGFTQYLIRSYLEIEAMTKAKYLAKEYIQQENLCNKEEEEKLISKYEQINKVGIKAYCYIIFATNIIRVLLYLGVIKIALLI